LLVVVKVVVVKDVEVVILPLVSYESVVQRHSLLLLLQSSLPREREKEMEKKELKNTGPKNSFFPFPL